MNKWIKQLQKLEGAVKRDYNPFSHVIQSSSPSMNFIFGNTQGVPKGATICLYGPPKGGKRVVINSFIGQLHHDEPDAIAMVYNTEFREELQMTDRQFAAHKIDTDRYQAYHLNQPQLIFDKVETDVNALCQEGAPIRLIVVDSTNGIVGRRGMNSDTVMQQQIGDWALTVTDGLKRILPVIRNNRIALILTCQVRAEIDPYEVRRTGSTKKMASPWSMKHFAEYFVSVEPVGGKAGRETLTGKPLTNDQVVDLGGNEEKTAHKIRVIMRDSSVGPKGRVGEFTSSDYNGIINQYEEVFLLATKRGIVSYTGRSYTINNWPTAVEKRSYDGKPNFINAIRDDEALAKELVTRVRKQDVDAMTTGAIHTEVSSVITEDGDAISKVADPDQAEVDFSE